MLRLGTFVADVLAAGGSAFAQLANNLSDLTNPSAARTNLGLGGAAVLSVGTTTGTVADGGVLATETARATAAEALKAPLASPVFTPAAAGNLGLTIQALSGQSGDLLHVMSNGGSVLFKLSNIGAVTVGAWNGSAIGANYGGTGQASYAVGDLLYASTTTALSPLHAGTNGYVMTMVGGLPTWAAAPYVAKRTQTPTYAASLGVSWASADVTNVTLTGNITITNSGAVDGQTLVLYVTQGDSGSYTLTFATGTAFNTTITATTLSTAVGATDMIGLVYRAATGKYNVVAFAQGVS
jgi:hypothetical protein